MPSSCGVVVVVLDYVLLCHALLLACGFYPYTCRLLTLKSCHINDDTRATRQNNLGGRGDQKLIPGRNIMEGKSRCLIVIIWSLILRLKINPEKRNSEAHKCKRVNRSLESVNNSNCLLHLLPRKSVRVADVLTIHLPHV